MAESRQQRRSAARAETIRAIRCVVYTTSGHAIEMDVDKIDIIARDTGEPLFTHVTEGEVIKAEVVQNGDWTTLRAQKK